MRTGEIRERAFVCARHLLTDLTLGLGGVAYDYLKR
jgi:acetoacetate decarboxylase